MSSLLQGTLGVLGGLLLGCSSNQAYGPSDRLSLFDLRDDDGFLERGFLTLGKREYQDGSLPLGRNQSVIGLQIVGAPPDNLVEFELGLFGAANSSGSGSWADLVFGKPEADQDSLGAPLDGSSIGSFEVSLGLFKEISLFSGWFRPYVGAGGSAIGLRRFEFVDGVTQTFSDWDLGLYSKLGLRLLYSRGASLGFEVRWLEGTQMNLGGLSTSADYFQWALTFSFFV